MLHLHGRIGRIGLGRAVGALCAALSLVALIAASAAFAADTVRPVVDVATLTGACVVALGRSTSGLFGTPELWVEHVRRASERAGDRSWPRASGPTWR